MATPSTDHGTTPGTAPGTSVSPGLHGPTAQPEIKNRGLCWEGTQPHQEGAPGAPPGQSPVGSPARGLAAPSPPLRGQKSQLSHASPCGPGPVYLPDQRPEARELFPGFVHFKIRFSTEACSILFKWFNWISIFKNSQQIGSLKPTS